MAPIGRKKGGTPDDPKRPSEPAGASPVVEMMVDEPTGGEPSTATVANPAQVATKSFDYFSSGAGGGLPVAVTNGVATNGMGLPGASLEAQWMRAMDDWVDMSRPTVTQAKAIQTAATQAAVTQVTAPQAAATQVAPPQAAATQVAALQAAATQVAAPQAAATQVAAPQAAAGIASPTLQSSPTGQPQSKGTPANGPSPTQPQGDGAPTQKMEDGMANPPRIRVYPVDFEGRFIVFIREWKVRLPQLSISRYLCNKYGNAIVKAEVVHKQKMRVETTSAFTANLIIRDATLKDYRVSIPADSVEINGVISIDKSLKASELVDYGTGLFGQPSLPSVKIIDAYRMRRTFHSK
jgi:hypothetical protein